MATNIHQENDNLLTSAGLSDEIGFVMRMAQLATFDNLSGRLRPTGLTLSQLTVLRLIDTQPGLRQQQIGDALHIKKTNLVALIDRLEQANLVERRPSPHDKRAHALHLTRSGARTLATAMAAVNEHLQAIGEILDPAEQRTLLTLLGKLSAGLTTPSSP